MVDIYLLVTQGSVLGSSITHYFCLNFRLDVGKRIFNHVNEFVSRYDRYDRHDSCSKSNTHCAKVSPGVIII